MIIEQVLLPQISIIDPITRAVTINIITLILKDDLEIARSLNSMTFQCDQMAYVKDFLETEESTEIDYLNSIWTSEFINAYHIAQQEQQGI